MMKRDEKGRFSTTEQKRQVRVYSDLLNKPFDSIEELDAAEEKYHQENDAKLKAVEEKKARAKEVEDAYLNYTNAKVEAEKVLAEARKKAKEIIAEAEKKYIELRDNFAKDYSGYHMTYTNVDGKEQVTFTDLINSFFNSFPF